MFRLNRNERSHWSGNGVHVESELVFAIGRNMQNGVAVDIPVQKYNWESYHSVVNQVSGVSLPAKHICEELSLRYCANTWDLHDASGVASPVP